MPLPCLTTQIGCREKKEKTRVGAKAEQRWRKVERKPQEETRFPPRMEILVLQGLAETKAKR
jgi:hypothetical protein